MLKYLTYLVILEHTLLIEVDLLALHEYILLDYS